MGRERGSEVVSSDEDYVTQLVTLGFESNCSTILFGTSVLILRILWRSVVHFLDIILGVSGLESPILVSLRGALRCGLSSSKQAGMAFWRILIGDCIDYEQLVSQSIQQDI